MGTNTPYLGLYIPDPSEKGYVIRDVFEPNFTKIDQECQKLELRKMQTEDTVAALIASNNYKVGDVIEVLGYYSAGDGAGHTRKIERADDGSGVQLGDQLWANIVHDGEVNVGWFGAKKNNFEDSYNSLNKCISYCKNTGVVCKITGKYRTGTTLDVTDVKLRGVWSKSELLLYKSKRLGSVGYGYMGGLNSDITFSEVFDEAIFGDCIAGDIDVILTTTKRFDIENLGVYGYARNKNSVGLRQDYGTNEYIWGAHNLNNVNAQGFGKAGIILHSLETVDINKLNVSVNNGYGLKVEKISTKDTMLEYTNFIKCSFANCRLEGLYTNTARKNIIFTECNFNNVGQYDFGIYSADGYDRNMSNFDYNTMIGGVKIDGLSDKFSQDVLINTKFVDCFGENCQKFVHIVNSVSTNGVTLENCYFQKFDTSKESYLLYLDTKYLQELSSVKSDKGSLNSIKISDNLISWNGYLTNIDNIVLTNKSKTINNFFNPKSYLIVDNDSSSNVFKKFDFKQILGNNIFYPSTGDIYKFYKFSLIFNPRATNVAGLMEKYDYYFYRTNKGTYEIISTNVEGSNFANCNPGTGEITIKTKAYFVSFVNFEDVRLATDYLILSVTNSVPFSMNYNIESLDTPYYTTKMQKEGVYTDFISYMDSKTEYDNRQREQEKNNQLAYEEALKTKPDLTYEEFMKHKPLNLIVQQEPQPSKALLKFKEKYLG